MRSASEMSVEAVEVVSVPKILGGMPVIKGTRVPAEVIRQSLIAGATKYDIFSGYPYLPVGAVEAVQRWAEAEGLPCSSS